MKAKSENLNIRDNTIILILKALNSKKTIKEAAEATGLKFWTFYRRMERNRIIKIKGVYQIIQSTKQ